MSMVLKQSKVLRELFFNEYGGCTRLNYKYFTLRRLLLYINVSAVDNKGESFARPEYYGMRNFAPLEALKPDCLLGFDKN